MARRRILICNGSHCRKTLRNDDRLRASVAQLPVEIERVGCQKVCRGPVVGLDLDGRLQWFERMSSRKSLRALAELVEHDTVGRPLRKRRNKKRSGKLRS